MRYLWLVFFAGFLYLSIVFITQNLDPIVIRFNLDELGLNFRFERQIFVPIFVTLALGILFCVAYFFTYHSQLRVLHRNQVMEVKRLKRLVLLERNKNQSLEQRNHELQQIVERMQYLLDDKEWSEEPRRLPEKTAEPA
jgi:Tfp pilus assembly protein PilO